MDWRDSSDENNIKYDHIRTTFNYRKLKVCLKLCVCVTYDRMNENSTITVKCGLIFIGTIALVKIE